MEEVFEAVPRSIPASMLEHVADVSWAVFERHRHISHRSQGTIKVAATSRRPVSDN